MRQGAQGCDERGDLAAVDDLDLGQRQTAAVGTVAACSIVNIDKIPWPEVHTSRDTSPVANLPARHTAPTSGGTSV